MSTLLHISASSRTANSRSRRLGQRASERICAARPALKLCRRDLAQPFLPHPDEAFVEASLRPPLDRDANDGTALALSESLIAELEVSDLLVVDFPMYNFALPSSLKAWLDLVLRPNRTFRVSAEGKIGVLADRPAICIMAAGGRFDGPQAQPDFATPHLRHALHTIGIGSSQFFIVDRAGRAQHQERDRDFDRWIGGLLRTIRPGHAPLRQSLPSSEPH
ncbi:hypothetical protein CCR90_07925 [Rhodovulum sulfidophilum]|uniref:FMN-dependent NADH-azoreductase n=1 Tax=Rhodovulum sulfidophilum TaxID=35806 RepID=UPI001911943E|nr:NAD(P)H-dependent oxidoreductase [Rhodovulum sulfidophilum]MBK5923714.1 hypothetical protein [Rhodovulum sulfidophilum]